MIPPDLEGRMDLDVARTKLSGFLHGNAGFMTEVRDVMTALLRGLDTAETSARLLREHRDALEVRGHERSEMLRGVNLQFQRTDTPGAVRERSNGMMTNAVPLAAFTLDAQAEFVVEELLKLRAERQKVGALDAVIEQRDKFRSDLDKVVSELRKALVTNDADTVQLTPFGLAETARLRIENLSRQLSQKEAALGRTRGSLDQANYSLRHFDTLLKEARKECDEARAPSASPITRVVLIDHKGWERPMSVNLPLPRKIEVPNPRSATRPFVFVYSYGERYYQEPE